MAGEKPKSDEPSAASSETAGNSYVVVARRYRPGSFADLVGQDQVAKALSNAIDLDRVGHAYLFTGARGVGKTSTARIFAKCLNCEKGPTDKPCGECDICQGISSGDDVDVLEIDGASNRGIEEIRQLRANVNVRPSRARSKIYIIDEVHMLTMQAFNALLKTLEEPPSHVKFFFCTTDPEKIPITVLSRCQRFDLPPISIEQIKQRLGFIAETDGVEVEEAALEILARRANGSMRDSQSLLDQLFSFCGNKITAQDVHNLLGTADSGQVLRVLAAAMSRQTSETLQLVSDSIEAGVDSGQMTEQILSLFRDMMALQVGCDEGQLLFCNSADVAALKEIADTHQLEMILAAIEILDNALVRMRQSTYTRTLLEAALVRICSLPDLQLVSDLVQQVSSGKPVNISVLGSLTGNSSTSNSSTITKTSSAKKKDEVVEAAGPLNGASPSQDSSASENSATATAKSSTEISGTASIEVGPQNSETKNSETSNSGLAQPEAPKKKSVEIRNDNCERIWKSALASLSDMTSDVADNYQSLEVKDDRLCVTMIDAYHRDYCQRVERKQRLEAALESIVGQKFQIDFFAAENSEPTKPLEKPKKSRRQKIREFERDPLVQQAIELFDAEVVDVMDPPSKKQ